MPEDRSRWLARGTFSVDVFVGEPGAVESDFPAKADVEGVMSLLRRSAFRLREWRTLDPELPTGRTDPRVAPVGQRSTRPEEPVQV